MPSLYIITGPNGAGKSTIGPDYIPDQFKVRGIFDGDKLFMNKRRELWKEGIKAIKESNRLAWTYVEKTFDDLVEQSLMEKLDFHTKDILQMKLHGTFRGGLSKMDTR